MQWKTRLLEENELYVFLSRPRRFGKSLLISTLKHLFAKDEELFAGTHIRGLPLWAELPTCPVLVLDMSELGMHLAPVSEFPVRLRDYVDEKTAACALACLPPDKPADAALRHLLQGLQALHGQKVVVLVDEYDTSTMHPSRAAWNGRQPSRTRRVSSSWVACAISTACSRANGSACSLCS